MDLYIKVNPFFVNNTIDSVPVTDTNYIIFFKLQMYRRL